MSQERSAAGAATCLSYSCTSIRYLKRPDVCVFVWLWGTGRPAGYLQHNASKVVTYQALTSVQKEPFIDDIPC